MQHRNERRKKTNERIFVLQLIFRSMIIFFSNEAKEMKNERQSLDPQVDDGLFPGSCCFFRCPWKLSRKNKTILPSSADLSKKKND